MSNPLITAISSERASRAANTATPNDADERTCKACGSPESAWRSDPNTSRTGNDPKESNPKLDSMADSLKKYAVSYTIAQAAHRAMMNERHLLIAGDSVNALSDAMKSLKR